MEEHPAAGRLAVIAPTRYAIVIEQAEGNYSAYVPDLPGCVSTGATVEEIIEQMREAIIGHLAVTAEYGEAVPESTTQVAYIEVPVPAPVAG
jgi:predicted RNase H-like HicB family nuclease